MSISLEAYDGSGRQFRLQNVSGVKFSNHYGEEGSDFGFLVFSIRRKLGKDYQDIGFGFEILLRKGLRRLLFKGIITKIEEIRGADSNELSVGCLGWLAVLGFEIQNFILSDFRLNQWKSIEAPSGSFVPDKIDYGTSWDVAGVNTAGIQFKPRRGIDYGADDYHYLRYTFQFGELARRITLDWETAFPTSWPGKLEIRDSAGNILLSQTTTSSGSEDLTVAETVGATYFEIRFYVTASGESTAGDDTVYVRLTNVIVYSTTDIVDLSRLGQEVLSKLAAGYSRFNAGNTGELQATGYTLSQAAFDTDQPIAETMKWAAKFGGENLSPVAWGFRLNDFFRIFTEKQDLKTIRYTIPVAASMEANISGDLTMSAQKIYGITQDTAGETARTTTFSDAGVIASLNNVFRKEALQLGQITAAQAQQAVELALSEKKNPKITSSFTLSSNIEGVKFDEIRSGGLVQLVDFRAREANLQIGDHRDTSTTFMLVGVEIDLDAKTATLVPAGDRSRFETYMAKLAELAVAI